MKDPYVYRVREVRKVVDGDTVDLVIDLGFDTSLAKRVRLSDIDAPESRTRDLEEKALGLEAKNWLKRKLNEAEKILIRTYLTGKGEKYGRVLGLLFINAEEISLNEQMIQQGYAWKYDGGTKKKDFALLRSQRSAQLSSIS
ncbi:MAG: thermonuclease family protein [Candidatus Electrothrix sp. AR3]|nr:thermonuclease family protein [Candidatus Electrothrix sp. AR3]